MRASQQNLGLLPLQLARAMGRSSTCLFHISMCSPFCARACCICSTCACSKSEEVGTCARVTAEPGPAALAAGASNVLQLSQSGNPRPPRGSSTCDARARFNYKVTVGPVKGDKCGAYQESISEKGSKQETLSSYMWV